MTVHSFARSKLQRQNMMNDIRLFSRVLVLGNSMRIDKRQSIQLCPPHTSLRRDASFDVFVAKCNYLSEYVCTCL